MTYDEFLEKCKKALGGNYEVTLGYLRNEWRIGGITGGSCWGNGPRYSVEGEAEPEWTSLTDVLLAVAPNMSFVQYKKLMGEVSNDTRSEGDYYGNSTEYALRQISFRNLYEALQGMGLL